MKIVCISDTHNCFPELPEGDVLIHAGDATIQGTLGEAQDFAHWWNNLDYKHKIFVAGNHDWLWQTQPALANSLVPSSHEKEIEIDGLRIYGASWTPEFGGWAFMLNRGKDIAERWNLIPEGIDILITHGPGYGCRDEIGGLAVGCRDLLDAVKRVRPKYHIFGHIHGGHGQIELYGTQMVNAAICDETYIPSNKPIVLEVET